MSGAAFSITTNLYPLEMLMGRVFDDQFMILWTSVKAPQNGAGMPCMMTREDENALAGC